MGEESTVRVPLTAESLPIEDRLREANVRKTEGNDYFRKGDWQEALSTYESAIVYVPQKQIALEDNRSDSTQEPVDHRQESDEVEPEPLGDPQPATSPSVTADAVKGNLDVGTETICAKLRAVLNANIGACYVKLGEHKLAVEACTKALKDDPDYVKALQRRASSNEILDTWSSLSSAQEDYTALLKLLSGKEYRDAESKLQKLKPRLEAAQKRETTEMVDKLKTLGNSLLGNFGLSTDNFKFVPNGQGGYSVNFSQ